MTQVQLDSIQRGIDTVLESAQATERVRGALAAMDALCADSANRIANYSHIRKVACF